MKKSAKKVRAVARRSQAPSVTQHSGAPARRRSKKPEANKAVIPGVLAPQQGEAAAHTSPSATPPMPPLADVISGLRELHRSRQDYHSAEKGLTLRIKAIQRRTHSQTCEAKTHAKCAGVYDEVPIGALPLEEMRDRLEMLRGAKATPQETGRARRVGPEPKMEKYAEQLPVWPWVKAIKGFGALGLAQIIAECGDLCSYGNPAKVWTRMGLGLYQREDGAWERQQKAAGQNGVRAQYNPRRRSLMFCIGECIVKAGGPYREMYDARKVLEAAKPACGKFKCKGEHCTPGHIHNRAKRYMEKQLLKNLWQEWRQAKRGMSTTGYVPVAAPAEAVA